MGVEVASMAEVEAVFMAEAGSTGAAVIEGALAVDGPLAEEGTVGALAADGHSRAGTEAVRMEADAALRLEAGPPAVLDADLAQGAAHTGCTVHPGLALA